MWRWAWCALLVVGVVQSYKSGAPTFTCDSMTPGHSVEAQRSPPPYAVTPAQAQTSGGRVRVMVNSPQGQPFVGYLLEARTSPSDTTPLGAFTHVPDNSAAITCGTAPNSAVTHKNNNKKKSIEVEWEAPADFEGRVTFVATVVSNFTTFWVGVPSGPVQVVKRSADSGGAGISTTMAPISSATKSILRRESALYAGCGTQKNCVGSPRGCIESHSCTTAAAISRKSNQYQIEMISKNSKFVAVGFSDDNKMGGDSVVECVHEENDRANGVRAYRSWNIPNLKKNTRIDEQTGFTMSNGSYVDGTIYCRLMHDFVISVENLVFDIDNNEYYFLLASGSALKPSSVGFHDVVFTSSADKRVMSDLRPVAQPSVVQGQRQLYNGCNVNKNCFGSPDGCVSTMSCDALVAVTVEGGRYQFEMQANQAAYVAVGLSEDTKMGGDSVVECVHEENSPSNSVQAYMSWNKPGEKANTRSKVKQSGINLLNGTYIDGTLYCKLTRDKRTVIEGRSFDLQDNTYYLLLAVGSALKENGVGFHDKIFTASGQKRALSNVGAFTESSKLLLRLHGAFMVGAWIGAASLGIVMARYFKLTWVGGSLCGKDHWFAWHRFFMLVTWCLTVCGATLIVLELGEWVSGNSFWHGVFGAITTTLCFIQPFMAAFRPSPGTPRRPLFNWLHWLVGNAAHIFAIVTIFLAVQLSKAELPMWMDWILVGYVAFYVFVHLVLSISGCVSESQNGKRANTFPMKEMNTSRLPLNSAVERKMDAPHAGFRKFMLFVHVVGILGLSIVLILIVVLAPVEKRWSNVKDGIMSL